jgi:hypothetical protein
MNYTTKPGAQRYMEFELESILIIISCGLKGIEKRGDGLQVIHTDRSRD